MQTYDQDNKITKAFTGSFEYLDNMRNDLLRQGKINKAVISYLPKVGEEITVNNLVFVVTHTNEFGKVIMCLKGK